MTTTSTRWWRPLLLAFGALLMLACGSGVNADTANSVCDAQRQRETQCFGGTAFDDCVTCQEQCGANCQHVDGSCPLQFYCK